MSDCGGELGSPMSPPLATVAMPMEARVSRVRLIAVFLLAFLLMPAAVASYLLWVHAPVPRSAEILAIVGNIGEWEMTATLGRLSDSRELAGPMKMTHIGWCSQDGPLEKTGALRVRLARMSSSIAATVSVDGVDCDYVGSLSDANPGTMACPGRRPVQMLLWLR